MEDGENANTSGIVEEKESYTFNDLSVVPGYADFYPEDVVLKSRLAGDLFLNTPFVSAAMDTVTEWRMATIQAKNGSIGIIHRNLMPLKLAEELDRTKFSFIRGINRRPVVVKPEDTLGEILQRRMEKGYAFESFPVCDSKNNLLGLVTSRHFQRHKQNLDITAGSVMRPFGALHVAPEETDLPSAYNLLIQFDVKLLPVCKSKEDHTLVGIYTAKDVDYVMSGKADLYSLDTNGQPRVGAAIGCIRDLDTEERIDTLVRKNADVLCIDVAHGDCKAVIVTLAFLREHYRDVLVIAGNVSEGESTERLIQAGASCVKVGIGPSSICTTRVVTGIGRPQLEAIMRCAQVARRHNIPICADGGIDSTGDIVKALAAGANTVMMGTMFTGTEECPGPIIMVSGKRYKLYRGMASDSAFKERQSGSLYRYAGSEQYQPRAEGDERRVLLTGSVEPRIAEYGDYTRKGLYYAGCRTIAELHEKARFCVVTQAGVHESGVRDANEDSVV